ncbi:MAG: NADH-quinone oxidoreductase subunit L [Anaerolineae bacterium]|nr:NADH-quinone oxidoreductase subunit L [Anaerolineae bacterium]
MTVHDLLPILTALIPLPTFIAFALIILFFNKWKRVSHSIAIGAMLLAFLMAQVVFWSVIAPDGHELAEHPLHVQIPWLPSGAEALEMGVLIDPLGAFVLFFVSITCLCIFVYSVGYMSEGGKHYDPRYSRFFAYISLFATGMLGLTVADNLLMLFIFWEIMGLCSYLLIGFWWEKNYPDPKQVNPRQAGLKAFMTTRVGDVIMLLGIAYLYSATGTLSFRELLSAETLGILKEMPSYIPGLSAAALAGLLLFGGTVGKSAQFPLHVWLPDAMEGPTPVSAMIHAATMVSAGVYMAVRMFPLLQVGFDIHHGAQLTTPMIVMALIGTFSAFMAATIAVAQDDIKRVLAYSTISQLAYMVAALGIGAYVAAAFHLIAHAFFKALLFLGSGSIIVGSHHEQDMMKMGGLFKRMPVTAITFIVGGLSLSGFPLFFAGFWSKDEILAVAYHAGFNEGIVLAVVVYVFLALGALLTAFYTGRQICLTFLGQPRSDHAAHAHEVSWTVYVPLIALALFAVFFGYIGIPEVFPLLGGEHSNLFHHFVGATLGTETLHQLPHPEQLDLLPFVLSFLISPLGLLAGYLVYGRKPLQAGQPDPLVKALGPLYPVLKNKYYVDELYDAVFIQPAIKLAKWVYKWVDRWFIDGILHNVARGAFGLGHLNRRFDLAVINGGVDRMTDGIKWLAQNGRQVLQTGQVQHYLLQVLFFLCGFGVLYVWGDAILAFIQRLLGI